VVPPDKLFPPPPRYKIRVVQRRTGRTKETELYDGPKAARLYGELGDKFTVEKGYDVKVIDVEP